MFYKCTRTEKETKQCQELPFELLISEMCLQAWKVCIVFRICLEIKKLYFSFCSQHTLHLWLYTVVTNHFFCDWQSNPDPLAKKWSKIRSRSDWKQPWKKGLAIKSRFPITITFLLKFRKFLWFLLQDVEVQDFSCTYYDNLYVLT